MLLTSWLSAFKTLGVWNRPVRRARKLNLASGLMEHLEDRCLLSTFHVALTGDDSNDGSATNPYRTVQKAIDSAAAASDGNDFVQVAAGTYNTLADIGWTVADSANTTNLSITGGWDSSFSSRTPLSTIWAPGAYVGAPPSGSDGDVKLLDANTTIDGFYFVFDGNGVGGTGGTRISGGLVVQNTGITISNNTIEVGSKTAAPTSPRSTGIQTNAPDTSNLLISGNTFTAEGVIQGQGVYLSPGIGTNTQITGNTFSGSRFASVIIVVERGDVSIANNVLTTVSGFQTVDIRTNSVSGPAITNLSITGNTIDGGGTGLGIHIGDGAGSQAVTGFVIANNIISNHGAGNGIFIGPGGTQKAAISGTIEYNSITGNGTGVGLTALSTGSDAIDASRNWWGDVSGPTLAANPGGLGQPIANSPSIKFAPWLIYSPDTNPLLPGVQLPTTVTVTPGSDTSAADNDFTRLQNAIGAAATGQTIDIKGLYNWNSTNASAAYLASLNTSSDGDIRGVVLPGGVDNLTITSSDSSAHIIGQGDLLDGNYESFLYNAGGTVAVNANLTVEKLNIDDFESAVTLGWDAAPGQFTGTKIQNNIVTIGGDNEGSQNIAFYLWGGTNQHITGNTVTFQGDGTLGTAGRSYGFQNATTGGTGYDGLLIDSNIFQIAATANGEIVTGVRENGQNDDNSSDISITQNQFFGINGVRNFDRGLMLTSQTTGLIVDGNIFTDVDDVFFARDASGGTSPGDRFTLTNNVLTRVGGADGIFLRNVTTDAITVIINWNINNTVDGFTGVRGLNELSVDATATSRPLTGASDLNSVNAIGAKTAVFVDDNTNPAGARFSDPDGIGTGAGPMAIGFNAFNTITAGVAAVDAGGTVNVAAGTYKENLTIAKSVTISGPNTGVSGAGTRSAEAHVVSDATSAFQNAVFKVTANNVTIQGLQIDGDDPLVTGAANTSGADTNTSYAVQAVGVTGGLAVRNNILANVFIGVRGDGASQGNVIDSNWFHDIGLYDFGYGVTLRSGFYADITNNLMTKVHLGVHVHNTSVGGPATFSVTGNEFHTYAGGIWDNLQSTAATPLTIDNDQFFAETGALANNFGIQLAALTGTSGPTITNVSISGTDYGVIVWAVSPNTTPTLGSTVSITGTKVGVYATNNLAAGPVGTTTFGLTSAPANVILDGASITGSTLQAVKVLGQAGGGAVSVTVQNDTELTGSASTTDTGILVSGSQATAIIQNNDASIHGFNIGIDVDGGAATITNNHIYDNTTGIRFTNGGNGSVTANNFDGLVDNGTDLRLDATAGTVAIGAGNIFAGDSLFIDNRTGQAYDLTSYTSTNWEGLIDPFLIEDKIVHAPDTGTNGLIRVIAGHVYVTSPGTGLTDESIQAAINAASSGDTINVASGTFVGNLIVDKSLHLVGPNAAIDPNTGTRVGEAIILPGVTETSVQLSTSGVIVRVGKASTHVDVTVSGFTIDGHNAALTNGRVLNGVEVNTGAGIANSIGDFDANPGGFDATLNVQNNIIQNLERYGVLVDGVNGVTAAAGNDISHNLIDNLPSGNNFGGGRGRATAFEANVYGIVSYNVMTRVNVGWQDDNYYLASPGAGTLIDHNTISTYHRGIFHNLQYSLATDATISNNTITAETDGDFPASTTNFGIELASLGSNVGASVTGNNISDMIYGILLWSTATTGNVAVSGGLLTHNNYGILATNADPQFGQASGASQSTISGVAIVNSTVAGIAIDSSAYSATPVEVSFGSGNTVTGGPVGLLVNGPDTAIGGNTLNDLSLSGQSGNYITLEDGALDNEVIDATGVSFDGLLPAAMSTAQKFATESRIQDQYDDATLGLIQITAGVYYVTPATSPTATDNDYTRLATIMDNVANGDTVILNGTFDWSEANAAASWALGNDGVAGGFDDYSLYVPTNVNDVTWTTTSLGAARIQGPGDLAAANLEGVFVFDGTDNQGWTISNLEIFDFDLSIGMFFGGGPDEYAGTTLTNNHIRVPADLNTTVAPGDVNQNIGIHFSFGTNQTISNNIIDMDGSGASDGANFSSSVGMQSNSGGGTSFDGLLIDNNTINVTGTLNAQQASFRGIWENGNASLSDITVSNNDFNNQTGNNGDTNLMRAFIITSHSGASSTVLYSDNTVTNANVGFQWLPGGSFGGNQPVQLTGNTTTNTQTSVLVQSNGTATLTGNTFDGVAGTSVGVSIAAGSTATVVQNDISGASIGIDNSGILDSVTENFIRNNTGDGIRLESGSQVSGTIFNNNLSGNIGFALNNLTATAVDASGNAFGVTTPAAVAAKVNGLVDYSPWLNFATDTDLLTAGFQGDFSSLSVYASTVQFTATGLIQEAVNLLAEGALTGTARTINVAGGIYLDAANLNRPLTLVLGGNVRVPGLDSIVGAIIDLQSNTLSLGLGNVDNTLAGNIQGSGGGLTKQGSAILKLTGTDTYTGTTSVNTGTLQVDGSTTSPTLVFGTLTGSGTIAAAVTIENGGGNVSPGGSGTATLHTGALTVSIGATFTAQVNGPTAGSQADQIATTGAVDVTDATLDVSGTITSLIGQVITLIDNGSGSAVVGEFAGHAEGSTVTINGIGFTISYHGGVGGNDVTLTQPPVVVTISDASGSESAGNLVFNLTLDRPLDIDFVIDINFQDGSATGGTDFTNTTQHITITAGQLNAQVTVPVTNDTFVEGSEDFTVVMSTATNLGGRGVILTDTGVGTINDDDSATVSIAKTFDGAEGAIPVNGQFTVSLSAISSTDTVLTYSVTGTATPGAGNDYLALSGTVTIPAGQFSAVINVPVLNDTIVEGTETVIATLTGFGAHDPQITLGGGTSATVNIADDDTNTLQITNSTVTEGNAGPTTMTFTVTSPNAVAGGFTVAFNVANVTTNGSDYTVVTSSPLTFTGTAGETHTITINVNGDTIVEGNETLSVTLGTITPVAPVPASSIITGAVGTGTITNDDSNTLTISSPVVTEGNAGPATMTFTVTSPNAVEGGFTVAFNIANVTTNGSDFAVVTSSPLSFTGTVGETQTITVNLNGDTIVEGNETFSVTLGTVTPVAPVQAASIVTGAVGTGTITNDDTDTLTISSPIVTEGDAGATTMTFTVTSPNAVAGGFTVAFNVANGTATGADYSVVTSSPLTFAGNANEIQTITINVTGDLLVEANETLTVTLGTVTPVAPVAAASIVTGVVGTGTITDNDSATVSVAKITDGAETNTPTNGKFTVTQSAVSSTDTIVSYSITGTATAGSDYTTLSGTVTIPAGQTSVDINVAVLTDNIVEATETVIVTLTGISAGDPQITVNATPATVNITDNDTATFTIDNVTVNEADGTLVFTLATDKALDTDVIINVTFGGGTATGGGTDYVSTTQSITFLAGQSSKHVSVAITDDNIVEATETFGATLSTSAVLGGRSVNLSDTGTGTITDNDTATFSINNVTVGEGAGTLVFDLTTDKALDIDVTITVTFTDVTATGGGTDYASVTQQITFLAGQISKQVTVAINNDSLVEGTETFTAALSSTTPLGGRLINVADTGTGTITDDDSATVTIAKITDGAETNTPTNGKFRVTQSAVSSIDTIVTYSITGTATAGIDYTTLTGTVTIPAGQTTADIDVSVLTDNVVEATETVIVTLTGISSGDPQITANATPATVNITDNDTATFTINDVTVNEADGTLVFNLTTDKALDTDVTINVTFGSGTATGGGTDYASTTQSITFLAGQISKPVSVAITNDNIVEGTETFVASLSTATPLNGRSVNLTDTGTGTITDNDTASFTINNVTVGEGDGTLVFDLVTDKALDIDVTITVTFTDISATGGGTDYASTTQQITFLAGQFSKQVSVAINDDNLLEGTETFTAAISSTTPLGGRVINVTDTGTGTITDNDTATVSIAKVTDGVESNTPTNGKFTVTLSAPSSTDTVVNYTIAGTATPGTDYTTLSGSVTIPAGQTTADIDVTVHNDTDVEDLETVIATLNGFGAHDADITLGSNLTATVNITDDDQLAITSGPSASVPENTLTSTVVLNVDADPVAGHTLTYSLSGPDAARFNINPVTGEITFVNSPNFEVPADADANNVYNVTVSVTTDITPTRTTTQDLTITVTPVNDVIPVFNNASPTFTVTENATAGTIVGVVSATDGDLPAQSLTYSIVSGNASGAFAINPTTGQISVINSTPLNFEVTPAFTLQVRVTDSGSPTALTADAMVEIHLIDVAEEPTITLPAAPATYSLHSAPVVVAPSATFDLNGITNPNFSSAKLTVSIIAGRDKKDRLAIIKKGADANDIHLKGKKVLAGSVQIGTVAGGKGSKTPDLVVTLNGNATQATVERLLERVTFQAKAGTGITRTVGMKLTNVSGVDTNVGTRNINVN
ncbi:MAG: hypothetical protein JWN70_2292 [Planctomycetaceae bacterium]|nr:hypothetical protein [Planctomycetaceae bacterium]